MDPGTDQFLTVIEAPGGWSLEQVMGVLVKAGVVDNETARVRSLHPPPCLVGICDAEVGRTAVDAIVGAGGDAACWGMQAIAALGETRKIKHFDIEPGLLVGELWRGGMFTISLGDVQVLVRGNVRVDRKRSAVHDADIGSFGAGVGGIYSIDSMVTHAQNEAEFSRARAKSRIGVSAKLDIHTSDGGVYQVDGDKFAYLALGDMKTQGDVNNMDRTLDLLGHVCGGAVIDRLYDQFRAPPQVGRFRIPGMKVNNDAPEFAFYSRWITMVFRHVAGWSVGR